MERLGTIFVNETVFSINRKNLNYSFMKFIQILNLQVDWCLLIELKYMVCIYLFRETRIACF